MADDEGIGDIYRIVGIRNIGSPRVFPKSNVPKKKKKPPATEGEAAAEEAATEPSGGADEEGHKVDIKA